MKIGCRYLSPLLAALMGTALFVPVRAQENVTVISKLKDLKLRVYGFVETDVINDSTQGLNEEVGNKLIARPTAAGGADNYAGKHHQTQMSVRNSRIGFDLALPKTDSGLETEGILELDLLGNNAANAQPGAGGAATPTQTERDFFNNPAVRVRHAYVNMTYGEWNAKIGQYWSLLGWQPYYFPGEVVVQPGPGQLYRRFAQARLTNTHALPGDWALESAADMAKPAEMNSGMPEFHGGLRLASTKYKGASVGGAGTSMVGLSAAVSGALIPIRTDVGNANGTAIAADVMVPIIPSSDGKDRSNNLSWMGEVMSGSGVGGLELSQLTAGVAGISATSGGGTKSGTAVDSGIAGINANNNAELIRFRTFRTHLQYVLPGGKWATSVGYAQVEGRNLDRFSNAFNGNASGVGFAPKIQFTYVSLFYDPLPWLRLGGEWNQTRDTYNDPANRYAINNRVQFSTFFTF